MRKAQACSKVVSAPYKVKVSQEHLPVSNVKGRLEQQTMVMRVDIKS